MSDFMAQTPLLDERPDFGTNRSLTVNSTVLDIKRLTIDFPSSGKGAVVSDVSLTIGEREIVALVGESGSGKTLTSLASVGLLPVGARITSGSIFAGDTDIIRASIRDFRRLRGGQIGMIFQEPMTSLNPVLTVGFQIAEAVKLHAREHRDRVWKRVLELLDAVGIAKAHYVATQYPHQLSGGMRQRVMIAIALAGTPRLLIADEPTTALDATVQAQVLDLMISVTRDVGASILLVTHDLGVVAQLADRVVVMEKGEIKEQADTLTLFDNPQHSYTRQLIAAAPRIEKRVSQDSVAATAQELLRVEGLTKTYPAERRLFDRGASGTDALKKIDLKVFSGKTLGVVGESGSGKSTLGHVLARLTDSDNGKVIFDGQDVTNIAGAALSRFRRDVQIIFQDPFGSLNPRMRIDDIITEPLVSQKLIRGRDVRSKAVELLKAVGLPEDFGQRLPHELSGGQRQRVGIARAISTRPKLIICDEPVSALDVSIQAQILDLLKRLQEEYGLTYIYIAHGLESVHAMSADVAVMQGGSIVEYGSRDQVFDQPAHAYTRKLLAAMMLPDPRQRRSNVVTDHSAQ